MSFNFKIVLSAVALSFAALAVQAQPAVGPTATPKVDAREARQQERIAQGAASGALTPHERHRLQHEQRAIHRAERHAKADGRVTPAERRHLAHLQHRASHHIYRQKHDAQTRVNGPVVAPR